MNLTHMSVKLKIDLTHWLCSAFSPCESHVVKNITQMRSAFVFVRPTERAVILGTTHQSENLSEQQKQMCLSRNLRAMF